MPLILRAVIISVGFFLFPFLANATSTSIDPASEDCAAINSFAVTFSSGGGPTTFFIFDLAGNNFSGNQSVDAANGSSPANFTTLGLPLTGYSSSTYSLLAAQHDVVQSYSALNAVCGTGQTIGGCRTGIDALEGARAETTFGVTGSCGSSAPMEATSTIAMTNNVLSLVFLWMILASFFAGIYLVFRLYKLRSTLRKK